jgi:hypothetical protein
LEQRDNLDHKALLELQERMVRQVRMERLAIQETRVQADLSEHQDQLVRMVSRELMVIPVKLVNQVSLDKRGLQANKAPRDLKDNEDHPDLLALLDFLD